LAEQRTLLRARPDDLALLNNTAWLLATSPFAAVRNATEAVASAERAVKLSDGQQPAILGTLAAAYAEARRFPEAVATAQRALLLADEQHKATLVDSLRVKLELYQAGIPYREMQSPPAEHAP
jgi:tetratricopeptide (TPR) repeat protein